MEGLGIFLFVLTIVFYFLPTIIASQRDHESTASIFFVNLLLGWTIIAWLAAVIWASTGNKTVVIEKAADPDGSRIKCPDCAELILLEAKVCKHCGRKMSLQ